VCAHAVRVTLEKLPGVESAVVSLNEGRVILSLSRDNTVTVAQIRQGVEQRGFSPKQALVRAEVDVTGTDDKVQLTVSGTGETYELAEMPHAEDVLQQLRRSVGQRVVIEGMVPEEKEPRTTPVIQVNSVTPVTRR